MIFGCAGIRMSRSTIPFFRSDAPSRVRTAIWRVSLTLMSFTTRASTTTESVITGLAGSVTSQAYRTSPPAPAACVPVYA